VDTNIRRHRIKFGAPLDKNNTTERTKKRRGSQNVVIPPPMGLPAMVSLYSHCFDDGSFPVSCQNHAGPPILTINSMAISTLTELSKITLILASFIQCVAQEQQWKSQQI